MTDAQLLAAVPTSPNLRQLLAAVGLAGRGGNYALYRQRLRRLGVNDARFFPQPRPPAPTAAQVSQAVAASTSLAATARLLRLGEGSVAHQRVVRLVALHDVDTSHFLGRASNRGRRLAPRPRRPTAQLLRRNSSVSSSRLKARLMEEGLLSACCAGCGRTTWLGRPIPLELDHVNGDRADNRLENLRLLCPNCHALTDTWRGRNIGRSASYRDGSQPP